MVGVNRNRLDGAVNFATLIIGEVVTVSTLLGNHLATGKVIASSPIGVVLENGEYYVGSKYLFVPVLNKKDEDIIDGLTLGPDMNVNRKLQELNMDKKSGSDNAADKDKEEIEKNDRGDGKPLIKALPGDIRKALKSASNLQDAQISNILFSVSEAAMDAMKKEGVIDSQLYELVADIRDAVSKVIKSASINKKG